MLLKRSTIFSSSDTTNSASSFVVASESVSLNEPCAISCGRPIARSTWEGSSEPDVQAEPLEPQMPFWDEGKYYPMMRVEHGSMKLPARGELEYGNPALQRSIGVWSAYLRAEQGKTDMILKTLVDNGQEKSDRYAELLDKRSRMVDMLSKIPAGCGQEMKEYEMQ